MARATGRRIGRMYGAIDDLLTLCEAYKDSEDDGTDEGRDTGERLAALAQALFSALLQSEQLASYLNERPARAPRAAPPPPQAP